MKGNYTANEVEALSLDLLFCIKNLRIIEYLTHYCELTRIGEYKQHSCLLPNNSF